MIEVTNSGVAVGDLYTGEDIWASLDDWDFYSIGLRPEQIGFTMVHAFLYVNDVIDLVKSDLNKTVIPKEVQDIIDRNPTNDWSDLTADFSSPTHRGYIIKRHSDQAELCGFNKNDGILYGIEYLHELQNFYTDVLPGEELKLSEYVERRLAKYASSRSAF
ncbi:hypothetical protein [Dyadobacter sp. CY323]|uniref:hypothetical protein n=1 Tax=Dyadobacter sp. CY323 TaxID=2907302 RepID=UPI001F1DE33C|nr:hypothetical protein [Dyadobacter sp. CY323]MCE6988148.1 hypothetical protein [Dyadobacter sp. CY323]